ncbi:MAG: DUF559 domain-containing protein [Ottowia sp.]|uniref:endonuclease domain-containing protein n=1 Tax=Ottowia sp. TaxID=1898956 RepID=UPI003C7338D2
MQYQSKPPVQSFARDLRRAMTEAERRLWSRLRGDQLGVKFRRQHPLGRYIADFACLDPKSISPRKGDEPYTQAYGVSP